MSTAADVSVTLLIYLIFRGKSLWKSIKNGDLSGREPMTREEYEKQKNEKEGKEK